MCKSKIEKFCIKIKTNFPAIFFNSFIYFSYVTMSYCKNFLYLHSCKIVLYSAVKIEIYN